MTPLDDFRLSRTLKVGLKLYFIDCLTGDITEQVVVEFVRLNNRVIFSNIPHSMDRKSFEEYDCETHVFTDDYPCNGRFLAFVSLDKAKQILKDSILPKLLKKKMADIDKITTNHAKTLDEYLNLEIKLSKL